MNLHGLNRSVTLWFIMICACACVPAQETGAVEEEEEAPLKTAEKVAGPAALTARKPAFENKFGDENDFYKTDFAAAPTSETTGEYRRQTAASNRELGFYAGSFTFHKDLKGESQKAPVVLVGVRYAWTTKNNPSHRLRYYIDFNPLIIVNYRERRLVSENPDVTVGERKTVFGIGFTPVGLQFNWRNSRKYQPFIAGGFGVAIFNKKFPDNRSALQPDKIGNRFQLMPEFGAGLEIRSSETKSYFIGYKYHHLSNGYTAPLNVGYNTNMVYGGMYFSRGR